MMATSDSSNFVDMRMRIMVPIWLTERDTSSEIFILNGGSISWSSRKQTTVALFTMEAEYMALSNAIRELLSRIYIITELSISTIQPTVMYSDNQAAISITRNEGDYRRAKHIDIRYHFIQNHLQNRTLESVYIPSKQQCRMKAHHAISVGI